MAELLKHIDIHVVTDFMDVSSYHGGTESSGVIKIKKIAEWILKDVT